MNKKGAARNKGIFVRAAFLHCVVRVSPFTLIGAETR